MNFVKFIVLTNFHWLHLAISAFLYINNDKNSADALLFYLAILLYINNSHFAKAFGVWWSKA